jgi:hypothetical protein
MSEPVDVYSDQFSVTIGPFGASLTFLSSVVPPNPNAPTPPNNVATIRTSIEHLKAMTFIMAKQIKRVEQDTGMTYGVPSNILNSLSIGLEDWDSFWGAKR